MLGAATFDGVEMTDCAPEEEDHSIMRSFIVFNAAMGDSSDDADEALLGEPVFKKRAASFSSKGVEGPNTMRDILTQREERKQQKQIDFLDSIVEKNARRRKERCEMKSIHEHEMHSNTVKTSPEILYLQKKLLRHSPHFGHIIPSSASDMNLFKLAHAILDLLSMNVPVEDVESINTSAVPCPKDYAERYQILNRKFKDVTQKSSLTKEAWDRAMKGFDVLIYEVGQMLAEEVDKHIKW